MGLSIYLHIERIVPKEHSGIFVRGDCGIEEITREEWDERNPGHEPTIVDARTVTETVFESGITHNLSEMADKAGIYRHLWRPEELNIKKAVQLIDPLEGGLALLKANPTYYRQFNAKNGWGTYENLVKLIEEYLKACRDYPEAVIRVRR